MNRLKDRQEKAVIETCPGCGSHLEDTWTGEECGSCGFRYLVEQSSESEFQISDLGPSLDAALYAMVFAYIGGAFVMFSVTEYFGITLHGPLSFVIAFVSLIVSLIVLIGSTVVRGTPMVESDRGGDGE